MEEKFPFESLVTLSDTNGWRSFSSNTCTNTSEAGSPLYSTQPFKSIVSLEKNSFLSKYGMGLDMCVAKTSDEFAPVKTKEVVKIVKSENRTTNVLLINH
jgi:hypothetical protein